MNRIRSARHQFYSIMMLASCAVTNCFYSFGADGAHGADPAAEVFDRYEASLRRMGKLRFSVHATSYFVGGPFQEETVVRKADWRCVRDVGRWKIDCRQTFTFRHNGELLHGVEHRQDLGTEAGQVNVWVDDDEKTVDVTARLASEAPAAHSQQEVLQHSGDLDRFATIPWPLHLEEGGFLFGYVSMDGAARLSKVMADSMARVTDPESRVGQDEDAVVAESRGPYGRHRVWFDPDAGFLPRRVEVEKAGSDIFGNTTVAALRMRAPLNTFWPDGAIERVIENIENVEIEQFDSAFIPVAFVFTQTRCYAGAASATQRTEFRVSDVDFDPTYAPSDFKITVAIPDGTPVAMRGVPQILYEWRDGRITKLVDQKAAWALAGQRFSDDSANSNVPILVAAVLFVAALIGCAAFLKRRRSASRAS